MEKGLIRKANEIKDPEKTTDAVIGCPNELEPVLAEIEHVNDLGKSKWYEVVYFYEKWQSYSGSETFEDGEQVVKWKYCKDCL